MASKPIYVLGTGLSHDGSACLLKDGRIHVAIEKERLTRIKHDGGNDTAAIRYCLEAAEIELADVSLVVQSALHSMLVRGNDWFRGERLFNEDVRVPVMSLSHHLAHAYAGFHTSPFPMASIFVVDGSGSSYDDCLDAGEGEVPEVPPAGLEHGYFEKDSFYEFGESERKVLFKDFSPWGYDLKEGPLDSTGTLHSIGGLYWAVSMYCFRNFSDAGKLMGLAPYGRPGIHRFPIFDTREDRVFLRYDWMSEFRRPARSEEQFKTGFQYYADLAYWVQKETERALLYLLSARRKKTAGNNLVYCGGVALNAVANERILRESGFRNVYIQPSAGDNGIAIGCCFYGWDQIIGQKRVLHDGSTCFGRNYREDEIVEALAEFASAVIAESSDDIAVQTAEALAEGLVVGWFQGGSEFGPRALGHRSILARPDKKGLREHINANIKFREDFRPFAPAILAEDTENYFDCEHESPYMLLTAKAKEEKRSALNEVIHIDGSGRLQTVNSRRDPLFYKLIACVKARTGIPVLLNTSLNRRGLPIVETPKEALELYVKTALDVLVIDRFFIRKRSSPHGSF